MTSRLQNKVFVSTRPKDTSDELTSLLTREGATIVEFPLIEIKATPITEQEKNYFKQPAQFNWILFTSSNGVKYFFELLLSVTGSYRLPEELRFAVIGEKTGKVLQDYGYKPSFVNPGSTAQDFSTPFLRHIKTESTKLKIMLPLGNLARTVIQDELKDAADCIRIDVYKTDAPEQFEENVVQQIKEDRYDMLIFTSPSGIKNFLKAAPCFRNKNIRMACIGPVTCHEAIENGFHPLVTAQKSSAEGIVDSILNYYISKT
jgi:uroporphyrinogen-III synthase